MAVYIRNYVLFAAVVASLLAVLGGLLTYLNASAVVDRVVDASTAALNNAHDRIAAELNEAIEVARKDFMNSVDQSSELSLVVLWGKLYQSFSRLEEFTGMYGTVIVLKSTTYKSMDDLVYEGYWDAVTFVRGSAEDMVAGIGVVVVHRNLSAARLNTSTYANLGVWWDMQPSGEKKYYAQVESHHVGNTWVTPVHRLNLTTLTALPPDKPLNQTPADPIEVFVGEAELTGLRWSGLRAWRTEEGGLTTFVSLDRSVPTPGAGLLADSAVTIAAETDMKHWYNLVPAFANASGTDTGVYFVAELRTGVVVAHTDERMPAPPMACTAGRVPGEVDAAMCLPALDKFSNLTRTIAHEVAKAAEGTLTTMEVCLCSNKRSICGAECPEGAGITTEVFFRKRILWQPGGDVLHVVWYRPAVEINDVYLQRQLQITAELELYSSTATAQIDQTRSDAQYDIDVQLIVTVVFAAVSFAICVGFAAGTVKIAVRPIQHLECCVRLLGEVQCDEAIALWGAAYKPGCLEVREIHSLGQGLVQAAEVLREYRSFLPPALLAKNDGSLKQQLAKTRPPTGRVAICFTDIVGSTKLWLAAPESMNEALETHNRVVRATLAKLNGYEVKTIGDAFMSSWESAVTAVLFGLGVHEDLVQATWPVQPLFETVSDKWARVMGPDGWVWGGLTVRIGISYGDVIAEDNPLTGRTDYRGPEVNLASRLEASAPQGSVCISQGCHDAVTGAESMATVSFDRVEDLCLKGVGTVRAYLATSRRLRGRTAYFDASSRTAKNPLRRTSAVSRCSTESFCGLSVPASTLPAAFDRVFSLPEYAERRLRAFERLSGSVAVITPPHSHQDSLGPDEHNRRVAVWCVERCMGFANRTQGTLSCVLGTITEVTWNVSSECTNHQTQILLFAGLAAPDISSAPDGVYPGVGIASGVMTRGNVGFNKQRFNTVSGTVPRCAISMSALCLQYRTFCIVAYFPKTPAQLEHLMRPVDVWQIDDHGISIEEPLPVEIRQRGAMQIDYAFASSAVSPMWYRISFEAVIRQGDGDSLRQIERASDDATDDHALCVVVDRLKDYIYKHHSGGVARIIAPFLSDALDNRSSIAISHDHESTSPLATPVVRALSGHSSVSPRFGRQ